MTATAPHPILEACDYIDEVSVLADELVDACTTLDMSLLVMGRLRDAIGTLQTVMSLVDARAIEQRGREWRPVPVPGGGIYKVSGGDVQDVYDNDRLRSAIANAAVRKLNADKLVSADGEATDAAPAITNLVEIIITLAGAGGPAFKSWRSGGADLLGINLAQYRERTTTDLRGRIEGRDPR